MSLQTILAAGLIENRRLRILEILRQAPAYTLDEVTLGTALLQVGSPVAVADLRDDLRHLRDRDCVRVEMPGGVWLATLTRMGGDAASGLQHIDGVARPGPA